MRRFTKGGRKGPVDPEAYWRRRFFILGGGLGAAMILAWVFGSGGASPAASQTAAARAAAATRASRTQLPAAAYGTAWTTAPATPSPSATFSAKPSASASPSASVSPSPSASTRASATPAATGTAAATGTGRTAAGKPAARCAPGDIVLSLFTSKPGYSPGQAPTFDVYAVSTQAHACQLAFGQSSVRVVVTRHKRVVWDSAACKVPGASARPVTFAEGVPQEVTLTWNRKAADAGCSGSLVPGEWGTFEAVATADGHSTPVRSFTLKS